MNEEIYSKDIHDLQRRVENIEIALDLAPDFRAVKPSQQFIEQGRQIVKLSAALAQAVLFHDQGKPFTWDFREHCLNLIKEAQNEITEIDDSDYPDPVDPDGQRPDQPTHSDV
jgi:hypothetical protein